MLRVHRLLVSVVICCCLIGCDLFGWPSTPFDHVVWLRTADASRYVMVRDIVDRQLLVGRTREQVEELLGPPGFGSPGYITYIVKVDSPVVTILDVRFATTEPHGVERVFTRSL